MSSLYFRGKLTYAQRFGRGSASLPASTLIITPTRGLQPPGLLLTRALIEEFAAMDLGSGDPRYRTPLERDLASLAGKLPFDGRAILLGSVATAKYVEPLLETLGGRLHYPPSFVGRGDMSRGGLLLRSAAAGSELEYRRPSRATARGVARGRRGSPRSDLHRPRGSRTLSYSPPGACVRTLQPRAPERDRSLTRA